MELYDSSYIHFLRIFIFLDMRVSYIKKIILLEIKINRIISDYNQGHTIWELHTGSSKRWASILTMVV